MSDFGTVAYNDLIYIVGGVSGNGTVFNTLWLFDPLLHNLTELKPMSKPRYRFGIALVGSKIYVAGGKLSDPTPPLNSLSIYDIPTNTWSEGPSASVNRSDPCATSLDGKVYLLGGYDGEYNPLGTVEEFDPATNKWQTLADLPTPRGDLMCAALNSTGLV
ncbi:hypothetical protein CBR_g12586 [Chara braunii]|uniref:Uncharacterized protein n=1 Tax=Chara braunii TaxID=69332 RepID=A0A388KS48_CHABU|nr:hypothetical protein CBR_g12586 [Chara braunii]|eukprot:GBG72867.1 hypothetical protein CBR_g12586 [Chara braunii]